MESVCSNNKPIIRLPGNSTIRVPTNPLMCKGGARPGVGK